MHSPCSARCTTARRCSTRSCCASAASSSPTWSRSPAGLGLYCYLLAHILWLHYVWQYSLLLARAWPSPRARWWRPSSRCRPAGWRSASVPEPWSCPGRSCGAAAYIWYATRVGLQPDFLGQWLPGQILSGIGVGATLPVASAGGLATVPAGRYATASAVNSSARQLGGVLGIAILTVFIAHPTLATFADDIRQGWKLAAGSFAVAAVAALFFGRIRSRARPSTPRCRDAPRSTGSREPGGHGGGRRSASPTSSTCCPPMSECACSTPARSSRLPAGDTLFRAGEPGRRPLRAARRALELQRPDGSGREFHPESTLGELALLTDAPRSGTVVARRDSNLVRVSRQRFDDLDTDRARGDGRQWPGASPSGSRTAVRSIPPASPTPKVIVAGGSRRRCPDRAASARALRAALRTACRVARLEDDARPRACSMPRPKRPGPARRADPARVGPTACLRQADRVVLVASEPHRHRSRASGSLRRRTARPDRRPRTTDRRLARRAAAVGRVLPPRPRAGGLAGGASTAGRPAGRRVGRPGAGRRRGALAGPPGRARSLRGSQASTVDRVAGTSMGALIASLYATGASAAEWTPGCSRSSCSATRSATIGLSLTSLARGERGKAMLRRCFGDQPPRGAAA